MHTYNCPLNSNITPMFLLHARLIVAMIHSSSLNIMLCICRTIHAMFILACRKIPLPPTCLLLGAAKMEKNPKAFFVARLPTRMRTTLKSFLYIFHEGITSNPLLNAIRGYMGLRVGCSVSIELDTCIYCSLEPEMRVGWNVGCAWPFMPICDN